MRLRPYQSALKQDVYDAWDQGYKNVLAVSPTGSGKTVLFSDALKEHDGYSCAIAHRQELVTQISLALARDEVRHRIIGPDKVIRLANRIHMDELGRSYCFNNAHASVAGVDTLTRRKKELAQWSKRVTKWVQDEAHHLLAGNKWGTAVGMFPNSIGLGVTATPDRADNCGLGRWADGVFDTMVEGPQMRDLINMGYLTDYRVFAPPSDLDLTNVNTTASGDYSDKKLKVAIRKSHVIGDVVKHYLRIAPGKLGITFATDVETATDIAREFNLAGVPAAVVHAGTPDHERVAILKRFKNRELLQLVNVDLFGEGFDLPAIEVVSMARPTKSYSLFVQQFGRALRLMISEILAGAWDTYTDEQRKQFIAQSSKPHAIIIDHVGNIQRHNLPDKPQVWTLNGGGRSKQKNTDEIPTRTCVNPECVAVYDAIHSVCPYCQTRPTPASRSRPEFVDGNLLELSPEALAQLRGEIAEVDKDKEEARQDAKNKYMPKVGEYAHVKRHVERQEMQTALRESIKWWGAYQRAMGRDDEESYKRFYFKFGIDVLSAQSLSKKDALELAEKINLHLGELAGGL